MPMQAMANRKFKLNFVIFVCSLLIFISFSITHYDVSSIGFRGGSNQPHSGRKIVKPTYSSKLPRSKIEEELTRTQTQLEQMQQDLEELWCATRNVMSTGGFCLSAANIFVGWNNFYEPNISMFVEDLVGNSSVVDFGAGLGFYGMYHRRSTESPFSLNKTLQKQHWVWYTSALENSPPTTPQILYSWDGYDGAFNVESLSNGFIKYADLRQRNLWLGRRWDWVVSVEVGEHIAKKFEENFLDNLVRHACKGILLTWALPVQVGHYHVNSQENIYIKQKMKERNFTVSEEAEEMLKRSLFNQLSNSAMVFEAINPTSCLLG